MLPLAARKVIPMEPNYQLTRPSVRAMMARRATAAEAGPIRRDWAGLADKSPARAAGIAPLWLTDERGRPAAGDRGLPTWRL